jgi:glycosyltransferase involved in cell wall biosynthesis
LDLIRGIAEHVDGFVVPNQYYAEFMSEYLSLDPRKFHVVPLGINLDDYSKPIETIDNRAPTIGYLARICPEKGFHILVDAFCQLAKRPGMESTRLRAAGWLSVRDEAFLVAQRDRIARAGLADRFHYDGVVDRQQKIDFLRGIDVLSVPTVYREPKGLYVLEALANGVPVAQPAHGAFPELLQATGGGRLVRANDPIHLADSLVEMLSDRNALHQLGQAGKQKVQANFSARAMATNMLAVYRRFLPSAASHESLQSNVVVG